MAHKSIQLLFGQVSVSSPMANIGLLLLRIYAGFTIMHAGMDKLPLTDWMVDQVASIGFPLPSIFAWIASFSEFAFGALLMLGLLTRLSGFMLAFTMGVAAFAFQDVVPLFEMHIAQHFFWTFILYMFVGAGSYSIDRYVSLQLKAGHGTISLVAILAFLGLLAIALYWEFTPEPKVAEEVVEIQTINVPGNFNDWDPTANQMTASGENAYTYDIEFDKAQQIEFKFTANQSWDINFGEEDQAPRRFPINGKAEEDTGGNTSNIKAYIPNAGSYRITLNVNDYTYSVDTINKSN